MAASVSTLIVIAAPAMLTVAPTGMVTAYNSSLMPNFFDNARFTGMFAAELRVKNAVRPDSSQAAQHDGVRIAACDREHDQRIDDQRHQQHRHHQQQRQARITRQCVDAHRRHGETHQAENADRREPDNVTNDLAHAIGQRLQVAPEALRGLAKAHA